MTSHLNSPVRRNLAAGLALIAFGVLTLLGQLQLTLHVELLILPALALIFLAWGLITRIFGLLIPGGILAGIALGSYLVERPLAAAAEPIQGGVFLLAFAVGWFLIVLLSPFAPSSRHSSFRWWPLVPGSILALIGALLLAGDAEMRILTLLGYAWPIVLMALGVWLILRRRV